jgi:hypothetical protein
VLRRRSDERLGNGLHVASGYAVLFGSCRRPVVVFGAITGCLWARSRRAIPAMTSLVNVTVSSPRVVQFDAVSSPGARERRPDTTQRALSQRFRRRGERHPTSRHRGKQTAFALDSVRGSAPMPPDPVLGRQQHFG